MLMLFKQKIKMTYNLFFPSWDPARSEVFVGKGVYLS